MTAHANDRPAPRNAVCSTCRAPIIWVRTKAGKATPLDATPIADGAWQISADGQAIHVATGADMFAPPERYTSHFATCPQAKLHRKR